MNAPDSIRAIAHGLVNALAPALSPGASGTAVRTARDVAQVLGFDGLDAVLGELERHAGAARPADLGHVVERLERLAAATIASESAAPFADADDELRALARALAETDWSATPGDPVPVYAANDVLADLPLQPSPDLARARLAAPVASALRAALEWVGADEALVVQGAVHDSALALTTPVSHPGGLGPAGAVLAACEGSLGPEADGRWTLRVPLHVDRPSYLLLRVGHVPVALPWHAVARLRMLPPAEWAQQDEALLDPPTPLQPGLEERPGALVALGLVRAWFVADRVVWRIAAHPEPASDRGPLGASASVLGVDDGERYWVLDPAWLLRGVTPLAVAAPAPRPRRAYSPEPEPEPVAAVAEPAGHAEFADAADAATPDPDALSLADAVARAIDQLRGERDAARAVPASAPAPAAPAAREPERTPEPESAPPAVVHAHLAVLRPEDVQPLGAPPADIAPVAPAPPAALTPPAPMRRTLPPPPPATPVARVPAPEPVAAPAHTPTVPGRRALVADDSLVARIFLARLLERRGYVVEAVGDGEALWDELRRGPWSLVCADATMPDAHGRAHLERLLDFRAACREPFKLVVLTRDQAEERDATLAGAVLHLRKPFEPGALDELLRR